MPSPEKRQ
jgi:hypothetical protein